MSDVEQEWREESTRLRGESERLRSRLAQCLEEANLTEAALEQRQQMFREWHEMKRELDAIAVFLRNNFSRQIELGEHAGLTASQVVIRYLGRYIVLIEEKGTNR